MNKKSIYALLISAVTTVLFEFTLNQSLKNINMEIVNSLIRPIFILLILYVLIELFFYFKSQKNEIETLKEKLDVTDFNKVSEKKDFEELRKKVSDLAKKLEP